MKPVKNVLNAVNQLFVDRDTPLKRFRNDIQANNTEKHVYFLCGEHTIGKSWFIFKVYSECSSQNWLTIWIDFSNVATGITDYLSILKEIHLEINQPFNNYQEATNKELQVPMVAPIIQIQTGSGNGGKGVVINGEAQLEDVKIQGTFAGRDNITVINNFYEQIDKRKAIALQPYVIRKITEAFLKDIVEFVKDKPVIFLFDDIGKNKEGRDIIDPQTRRWLIEDFVCELCNCLPNARFVITQEGDEDPNLKTALFTIAETYTLKEFGAEGEPVLEIYQSYLNKNGIPPQTEECLNFVHNIMKGRPAELPSVIKMMKGNKP